MNTKKFSDETIPNQTQTLAEIKASEEAAKLTQQWDEWRAICSTPKQELDQKISCYSCGDGIRVGKDSVKGRYACIVCEPNYSRVNMAAGELARTLCHETLKFIYRHSRPKSLKRNAHAVTEFIRSLGHSINHLVRRFKTFVDTVPPEKQSNVVELNEWMDEKNK